MSLDSDNITVERLAGTCGAIVRGIDMSTPQSPADIERLKTLLDEHLVIALPEQDIDLDRQEQFTDEFGGRSVTPFVTPVEGRPNVIRVIKEPTDELNFANNWHTDLSYLPAPPAYTILHARQVPDAGGDTMWANQYMAYETLPDKVKDQINGLRTTHSAGLAYGTGGYLEAVAGKSSMGIEPSKDAYETRSHPLVIRHPRTGRPALFVNSSYTTEIDGMDADQGRELLVHRSRRHARKRLGRGRGRVLDILGNERDGGGQRRGRCDAEVGQSLHRKLLSVGVGKRTSGRPSR